MSEDLERLDMEMVKIKMLLGSLKDKDLANTYLDVLGMDLKKFRNRLLHEKVMGEAIKIEGPKLIFRRKKW